jgi:6-phosphogluconolactonase
MSDIHNTLFVGCFGVDPGEPTMASYRFHPDQAALEPLALTDVGVKAPLFVQVDPTRKFMFIADNREECQGTPGGAVVAYAIDPDSGSMSLINEAPVHGQTPCYIDVTRDGRFLLVANFTSGTVSVLARTTDGGVGELVDQIDHSQFGAEPHAHCALLSDDERFLISADLGIDRVFVHRFDPRDGKLSFNDPPATQTAKGAGPRHVAFSPDRRFLFAMTEYDNTAIAMRWDADKGVAPIINAQSALPEDFTDTSYGSDCWVHPSGRFVYVSNRGHESVAVFAVDQTSGELSRVQIQPLEGKFPRSMALDHTGEHLIVGVEKNDHIAVFKVDSATGRLTPVREVMRLHRPGQLRLI